MGLHISFTYLQIQIFRNIFPIFNNPKFNIHGAQMLRYQITLDGAKYIFVVWTQTPHCKFYDQVKWAVAKFNFNFNNNLRSALYELLLKLLFLNKCTSSDHNRTLSHCTILHMIAKWVLVASQTFDIILPYSNFDTSI